MKKIKFFSVILLLTTILSCSEENTTNQTFTYKSEKVNFTQLINHKVGKKKKGSNQNDDYIYSELKTTFYIPENLSNVELEKYLNENQNEINGSLKYYINDEVFISIEIIDGQEVSKKTASKNLLKGDYPCTYDGIQACVQDVVYKEWTTLKKLYCAAQLGVPCIVEETVYCIEKNCI